MKCNVHSYSILQNTWFHMSTSFLLEVEYEAFILEELLSKQTFLKKTSVTSLSDRLTIYLFLLCAFLKATDGCCIFFSFFLGCIYSRRWSFQFQSDIISICYWGRSLYWYVKSGWYCIFESRLYSSSIPSQISCIFAGKSFFFMWLGMHSLAFPICNLRETYNLSFCKSVLKFPYVLLINLDKPTVTDLEVKNYQALEMP